MKTRDLDWLSAQGVEGSWKDKAGSSVIRASCHAATSFIYGWGMRNGSVKGIGRMSLLVSKDIHVEAVFFPINPSQNSLLTLETDIPILISPSVTSTYYF